MGKPEEFRIVANHPTLGEIETTDDGGDINMGEHSVVTFTFHLADGRTIVKHKLMTEAEFLKLSEHIDKDNTSEQK